MTTMKLFDVYLKSQYAPRKLSNLGQMVVTDVNSLTDIIFSLHAISWDRLWSDYTAEYNPIWNVDGTETETETRNLKQSHTGTDNYNHTGTDNIKSTGTDSVGTSGTIKNETDTSTYGFDSASAVPSGKSVSTDTPNTTTNTNYGKTDTSTYNSSNNNTKDLEDTDTGTVVRELVRGGNIGVTKTQELLTADQEYWTNQMSKFYKQVIKDIVDEITYKIHTESEDD